ncbi:hypothetical protein [Campylobacter sputorum]|uniref:hypothetical protein n=1 Tax=Campylobacter sputorum TaxID=206 RepID=UPI00125FA22B|nr:hypothetical protein [Campylobacter sputorum]ASM37288.1 hypothetical protein CSF_1440 [Campylobacter sputorum bv. faecalis CCUG 20703]
MRYVFVLFASFIMLFSEENVSLQITDNYIDIFYLVFMAFCFIILVFMIKFLKNEFKKINDIKAENKTNSSIKNENFLASNNENIFNLNFQQRKYAINKTVSNINIFSRLSHASRAIFDCSFKNRSVVIFDFDDSLDKKYNVNSQHFIQCLVSCIKFFLQEFKENTILIEFFPISQGASAVNFELKVSSNSILDIDLYEKLKFIIHKKNMLNIGRFKTIYEMNKYIDQLGWSVKCENVNNFSICFNGFLKLGYNDDDTNKTYSDKFKNLSSVLLCNNLTLKNIIIKQVEKFHMDIKPCENWEILNEHIKSRIYLPAIVFIYIDDYNGISDEMYQSLQENKKKKNFVIVFFIGNRNQINRDLQIGDFFITSPYTINTLKNVLDLSYGGVESINKNENSSVDFIEYKI